MTTQTKAFDLPAVVLGYLPSELFIRAGQAAGIQNRSFSTDVASVIPLILRGLADQVAFRRTGVRLTAVLAKMSDETIPLTLSALDAGQKESVVIAGRDLLFEAIGEEATIPLIGDVARQLRVTKEMASNLVALLVPAAFSALADIQRYYALGSSELETTFEAQSDNIEKAISAHQEYAVGYQLARRGTTEKPAPAIIAAVPSQNIQVAPRTSTVAAYQISVAQKFSSVSAPSTGMGVFGLIGSALALSLLLFGILSFSAARNNARFLAKQEQDAASKQVANAATPKTEQSRKLEVAEDKPRKLDTLEFRDARSLASVAPPPAETSTASQSPRIMPFVEIKPIVPAEEVAVVLTTVAPIVTASLPEPSAPPAATPTTKAPVDVSASAVPTPQEAPVAVAVALESIAKNPPQTQSQNKTTDEVSPQPSSASVAPTEPAVEGTEEKAAKIAVVRDPNEERRQAELKTCRAAARTASAAGAFRFETAKDDIEWGENADVLKLLKAVKACGSAKLRIEGHTDADGTGARNAALSTRRAKTLYDFFASSGVSTDRMTFVGLGASKPIAPNTTDEKVRNRRLEIHFE